MVKRVGFGSSEKEKSLEAEERVAAVVVTYNRKALLQQCLDALQEQTHPLAEIIVVDNASTDGTRAMVREAYPEVDLLALEENRGGAGGFHAGMRRAMEREVDWIWVMDDDAEPVSDALEQLFAPGLHHNEDTVALTSLRVNPDGSMQKGSVGWYHPLKMKYDLVGKEGGCWEQIGYATFVGLMVRATTVSRIGLPEADYFIHADDNEYVFRLSQNGLVYLVRNSKVIHHDAEENKKLPNTLLDRFLRKRPIRSYWRKYYALRNKLLIVRRHAQTPFGRWYGYVVGLVHLVRGVAAIIAFDNFKCLRLRVLFIAYTHGVTGKSGKQVDPVTFPS